MGAQEPMEPVIEVHPSLYVMGGQQPMVLMKERHFAIRRGWTANHGFYVGAIALQCIIVEQLATSDFYHKQYLTEYRSVVWERE